MAASRRGTDSAKNIIKDTILEKLDVGTLLRNSFHTFRIVDLESSVGPNAFFTVQNIIDSLNLKFESQHAYSTDSLEFQVFFNDHVDNDFNTLFKFFPEDKKYYAAAVPGSFHGRLFIGSQRALELVPGGIMILITRCVPPNSLNMFEAFVNIMGNILVDMANKVEKKLSSEFNILTDSRYKEMGELFIIKRN
ncbi:probable S-adenosylmethionine-dependent methyltransferase At5g37970 [Neltuma alba]|uniref:probable S-adenosylmethionine-dependent methyltransferase At5g37970 n=1 Tax=Neltuma alba TaxID=207710 RepID=UPI0010A57015|nr:probable S-adenosylmethionine-dependent methyltransferase At5g37970 [Prosopis alba]